MGTSLFKGKDIFSVTSEEFISVLPGLSLRDIAYIVESDWWIRNKDHPSFADLAKGILYNFKNLGITEVSYSKKKAYNFTMYILGKLETYEGDKALAEAIKHELQNRIKISN